MDDGHQELVARIRRLEAERDRALRTAEAERRRADRAEAQLAAMRAHARKAPTAAPGTRWVEHDTGHRSVFVGPRATPGEQAVLDLPWPDGWLVVGGLQVVDSTRTREVDALVVTPAGLVVVEQKDVRRGRRLVFAPNGAPLLDGHEVPHLAGALHQARLPAQILASTLRDGGVHAGFIHSVLAVRGVAEVGTSKVGDTHVSTVAGLVRVVQGLLGDVDADHALGIGTVEALVVTLGLPQGGLPPLASCGFASST